jgi:hypothetical protein
MQQRQEDKKMMTKKRKATSKAKNQEMSHQSTTKKVVARTAKKAIRATRKGVAARGPLEFVQTEPLITVYEIVETEMYGGSDSEVDDRETEFGT